MSEAVLRVMSMVGVPLLSMKRSLVTVPPPVYRNVPPVTEIGPLVPRLLRPADELLLSRSMLRMPLVRVVPPV